ncbi:MAG: hypothetical protein ACYCXO_05580 [Candidatus Humimicrobiaceae bacterium]
MQNLAIKVNGKKFMWDSEEYLNEEDAKNISSQYKKDGFEVFLSKEGEKFFIYTRRIVTEIKIDEGGM